MSRKQPYTDAYLNDAVPQFCKECAKYASCDLCHDEQLRERCPLLQEDVPLCYRNSEGYADPTTYFALRNVEQERKHKAARQKRKAQQEKNEQSQPVKSKRRHNTQVIHY